jgi:ribosomal protein S18 acetylase RimI-like enzyme
MHLVRLGSSDLDGDMAPLVSWIVEAWKPYRQWLLGEGERAAEVAQAWLARDSSELSITGVTALLDGETHLGGYVAVSGHDLPSRRKADLLWLWQHADDAGRRELAGRLNESRGLFASVEPRHFYLSKIGVLSAHRGKGLGRVLVDDFVRAGLEEGHEALRVDVWADNESAVRLYRKRGFETISEAELVPLGVRYLAMTLARGDA